MMVQGSSDTALLGAMIDDALRVRSRYRQAGMLPAPTAPGKPQPVLRSPDRQAVLRVLAGAPDGTLRQSVVASRMGVAAGTVHYHAAELMRRGFLVIGTAPGGDGPGPGTARWLTITPAGRAAAETLA